MATTKVNTNQVTDPLFNSFLSRQAIINGGFTVNQRVYVSNATLASGAYGHDRWKAGASGGDYTFTQLAQATIITIKTGKSLIQVIEDKNVIGGTYTLSWTGTAQARFGINSATPSGAYAASPITITTQTAGTVMSVEFNEGTLGQVNLANSSVALPFMPKSYEEELRACMRYYYRTTSESMYSPFGSGICSSTTKAQLFIKLPIPMRVKPTSVDSNSLLLLDYASFTAAVTGVTIAEGNPYGLRIEATVDSGLTYKEATFIAANNSATAYIGFSAEL